MWDDRSLFIHQRNRISFLTAPQVHAGGGKHQSCYLFLYSGTTSRRAIARIREVQ